MANVTAAAEVDIGGGHTFGATCAAAQGLSMYWIA